MKALMRMITYNVGIEDTFTLAKVIKTKSLIHICEADALGKHAQYDVTRTKLRKK